MIVDNIEQKFNFLAGDAPNAFHAWSALSRRLDRTDHLLVEAIKAEMGKCRLVCVCDVEAHLERLEALFVKLKRAGLKLDVKNQTMQLATSLDGAFTELKSAVYQRMQRLESRRSQDMYEQCRAQVLSYCLTLQHAPDVDRHGKEGQLFVICATRAGIVSWIVH